MIGSIQRTFNRFHLRKADRLRTYHHDEILRLERMIIETIEKESKNLDTGVYSFNSYKSLTRKLIGGNPEYYQCQFSGCGLENKTVKPFNSNEEGIVFMCAKHRAFNEGKTGHSLKKGERFC